MFQIMNWGVLGTADITKERIIPTLLKTKNSRLYAIAGRKKEKVNLFKIKFNPVKEF